MPDHAEQPPSTLEEILAQRRRRTVRWIVILLLLAVAAGIAVWWMRQAPPPPPPPAPPPAPVRREAPEPPPPPPPAPAPPQRAEPAPPPPPPLPALEESDAAVREQAASLSSASDLAGWLIARDLIVRFVTSVDNIAEGKTPRAQLETMWPVMPYRIVEEDESILPDPRNESRYDAIADAFVGLDPKASVAAYRRFQPLFQQAYAELGYPDRSFDLALRDAIDELLRTPVVVGTPALGERVLGYAYADPYLESLSDAQKQLLRTGPSNAPRIQKQLRALARELGIPASQLPKSPVHEVQNPAPE